MEMARIIILTPQGYVKVEKPYHTTKILQNVRRGDYIYLHIPDGIPFPKKNGNDLVLMNDARLARIEVQQIEYDTTIFGGMLYINAIAGPIEYSIVTDWNTLKFLSDPT